MNKKNAINRLLTAIAIVFSLIFLIPPLAIYGVFWVLEHDDNTGTDYYNDGTVVYHRNGPVYDHVLFDHYSVTFNGEGRSSICRIQSGKEACYDKGRINKFTFDKKGFIAYHVADDETNEYRLFCKENETIQTFLTMKELYDYCTEKNIRLGKWYHGRHLEQTFFENNGWSLTTNSGEVSFIRNNGEELFTGQIDKYFYTNRYLFFKFQHFNISRYDEEPNPVIPVDESVILGKRIMKNFFPFRDEIHAEKYTCIDTETGKYIIFDDEKSIEEYAASLGIIQKWEKIKFNDKVNN
ncbi:MAG: hypothetical protein IKV76_03930 [Clostridia bacterium]|nr:hypothetical protein [Clostridia bacterium]